MATDNEMFPNWKSFDLLNNPPVVADIPADSFKSVFTVWEGEGLKFIELRDGTFYLVGESSPQENS